MKSSRVVKDIREMLKGIPVYDTCKKARVVLCDLCGKPTGEYVHSHPDVCKECKMVMEEKGWDFWQYYEKLREIHKIDEGSVQDVSISQ